MTELIKLANLPVGAHEVLEHSHGLRSIGLSHAGKIRDADNANDITDAYRSPCAVKWSVMHRLSA